MNPKLKENIDQILNTIQKVNENAKGFINALDFCSDPDEKDLTILLNVTSSLNDVINIINNKIEQSKSILIDSIYFIDPDVEEYYKIRFNKSPNSNLDPDESQDH
jgi:hypothetical protein